MIEESVPGATSAFPTEIHNKTDTYSKFKIVHMFHTTKMTFINHLT